MANILRVYESARDFTVGFNMNRQDCRSPHLGQDSDSVFSRAKENSYSVMRLLADHIGIPSVH